MHSRRAAYTMKWLSNLGHETNDFQIIHAQQATRILQAHLRNRFSTYKIVFILHLVEPGLKGAIIETIVGSAVQHAAQRMVGGNSLPVDRCACRVPRRVDALIAQILS